MTQEPEQLDLIDDWKLEGVKPSRFREILKSKYLWTYLVLVAVFSVLVVVVWLNFNLLVGLVVHEKLKDLMLDYWIFIFAFWAIILTLVIWLVPIWQVKSLKWKKGNQDQSEFDLEKERIKLRDDIRKTLAQIIGGAFFLLGLFATYNTFELNRQGQELNREGQVTERFSKAVALLKEDDVSVRLGGLYALERVAKDSPKDHSTVMEILAAYIREKSKEQREQSEKDKSVENKISFLPTDVVAAINIIIRRDQKNDTKDFVFDLSSAFLNHSILSYVNLNQAYFYRAILSNANLNYASLNKADFSYVYFNNASLLGANLNGATFTGAKFNGATLINANLVGAKVFGTNFIGANLNGADLSNVDFRNSNGLNFEQISKAIINEQTMLPDELEPRRAELLELSKNNLKIRERFLQEFLDGFKSF